MATPVSTVTLIGCDGSIWNLLDPTSPVQLVNGLSGLHLPPVTHRWATTARGSGRHWKGSITDSRTFTMNVFVGDPAPVKPRTGNDWRSLDGVFWRALSTDLTAELIVDEKRSLTFRLDGGNHDLAYTEDPALRGRATYPINCIADDPAWRGDPITATFSFAPKAATNYYGDLSGLGPLFYISGPDLFDSAYMQNPGDEPAPPVWTIRGPASAFRVGVEGHVTQPPFALQDGDVVIIDTAAQTIMDPTGNSLWPLMGFTPVDFAPVPPGDAVPIAIGMDNPGAGASISVSLTPLFRRAWGATLGATISSGVGSGGLGGELLGDGPLGD